MGLSGKVNSIIEWDYISETIYKEPFFDVELNVNITKDGKEWVIPAFWRGGNRWSVRFIPKEAGKYKIKSRCSDKNNNSLDNIELVLSVEPSQIKPPREIIVTDEKSYLTANGKPFFWLSDTWWMALSGRLRFNDLKEILRVRKEQGFNVIQLVAGLFPDMDSFDKRGANSGGFAWKEDYSTINPAFFDEADKKIEAIAKEGFTLCILGSWGYYLPKMGLEKIKHHWRYIVARWGAYSVVWCVAGEATMPYYLSTNRAKESKEQKEGWSQIAKYIRSIDSYGNLITIHPIERSVDEVNDSALIDINLLQASHNSYASVQKGVELLKISQKLSMPTIMDEINYEGILRDTHAGVQRVGFWSSVLSGSKGFGYGANGIWQVNTLDEPYGNSPSGANWGNQTWQDALELKGAKDIAKAKEFLEELPWQYLEPMQEQIEPKINSKDVRAIRVAGVSNYLRVVYIYNPIAPWDKHYSLTSLEKNQEYNLFFWDPQNYIKYPIQKVFSNSSGKVEIPTPPSMDDWVVVIEKVIKSNIDNKPIGKIALFLKKFIN